MQGIEGEKKQLRIKLKEKSEAMKVLQDAWERKDQELQAKTMEARTLAVQVASLKRDASSRDLKKVDDDVANLLREQLADREASLMPSPNQTVFPSFVGNQFVLSRTGKRCCAIAMMASFLHVCC